MNNKVQIKSDGWPDCCSPETIKNRCQEILEFEKERHKLLSQCGKCSDVLYADFRYDEICAALDKFKAKGLNLETLFKFQEIVNGVVYPWNLEYNTLRQDVNRRFNVFPLVIVMTKTEEDVIRAYKFARKFNIDISLRGGAHSFEAFSLINDGMVIDQSKRKDVEICQESNTITIQPGVLIGPLMDQLSEYGLTFPIGSCVNNAICQYSTGGGIGDLIRSFGTGSDNILEAKIMLASGEIVIPNEKQYSDLFWALRGAGIGNYGIVLSLKLRVFPLSHVYIFDLTYEFKDIKKVLSTWFHYIKTAPIELTANFKAFNNKTLVSISGMYLKNNEEKLRKLLKPLFMNKVEVDIKKVPFIEAVKINAGRGRWQPFFKFKNSFVECSFPEKALDIVEYFMSIGNGSDYLFIDSMGGVNDDISPTETAFVHRGVIAWLHMNAQWSDQKMAGAKMWWANELYKKLQPYLSFQVYQNTSDLQITDHLERYYGQNLPRLVKIKKKYDPENIFHYAQSIPTNI